MGGNFENECVETIFTDEKERIIVENVYDCWETLPINAGSVERTQTYQNSIDEVNEHIKNLKADGVVLAIEKDEKREGLVNVRYSIPLVDIKIPEKFPLGYYITMDKVMDYLKFYESLDIPSEILLPQVQKFANEYAERLIECINNLKDADPNAPFEKIDHTSALLENWDLIDIDNYMITSLGNEFPEVDQNKPSLILQTAKEKIMGYLISAPQSKATSRAEFLFACDLSGGQFSGRTLCNLPLPAVYHDDMVDSRFAHGTLKAGISWGNVVDTKPVHGDIDESAAFALLNNIKVEMSQYARTNPEDSIVYTPPNTTNLFIIDIPATTSDILNAEASLNTVSNRLGAEKTPSFPILMCSDLTRLNPNVISEVMNKKYGRNGWVLAQVDSETNTLRRAVPKPKEQWKVRSSKPRINVPYNTGAPPREE